jgi:predicted small secreted protein
MKKKLKFRSLPVILMIATVLFIAISCDKNQKGDQPELPPVETLFMSYADFDEDPGVTKGALASYENFHYAYSSLLFWHSSPSITLTMALPIAAYGYALTQESEYVGDNTWKWSFDFQWNQISYIVTLTASRENNEEFSILMDVAYAELPSLGVKWFDGMVRYDHTHATWTIYKEGTLAAVEGEMHYNYETNVGDLKYTYVEPEKEETGSYILYEYDQEAVYDASYTVSYSTGMTMIEWDTTTKEGHVKDENHFQDADWHCWDTLANGLVDKICE